MPTAEAVERLDRFIQRLKRRDFSDEQSENVVETIGLIRSLVHLHRGPRLSNLAQYLRNVFSLVSGAHPFEPCIANVFKRAFRIIRDVQNDIFLGVDSDEGLPHSQSPSPSPDSMLKAAAKQNTCSDSLMYNSIAATPASTSSEPGDSAGYVKAKSQVILLLNEFIDEIETMHSSIAAQSFEHIHSNEIIMTFGYSRCVEEFLLNAARKRHFQVIVVEGAPKFQGQRLAVALANASIDTTLATDSAIFALMSRVNKVIVGCSAVLANGGIVAQCGTLLLAVAAKHHSTPIIVLSELYRLTPAFPYDVDRLNTHTNPNAILSFAREDAEGVEVVSPTYDYISPEHIACFVVNTAGSTSPSYVYRLLGECYDEQDFNLP